MKSVHDKNAPKAAYLQLYEQLKRDITARHYEYGHRLPSKRSTAADKGVSVITVEHAYALLCEEGYVEARERSGYFVIYKPADFLAARETASEPGVTTAALSGASGEFPYSLLAKKMRKVLSEQGERLLVKSPNRGCLELRTALCAGATGVIIPEDRSSGITPAAVRASAGAAEHLKVAHVVNLVRAMKDLKDAGVWFTGLDWGEDAKCYTDIDFKGRAGLVVGAEGEGISRLVRENCDCVAELPMPGGFESLNAGVAAGITLYEILRQRG